jgi:hypothetical protein
MLTFYFITLHFFCLPKYNIHCQNYNIKYAIKVYNMIYYKYILAFISIEIHFTSLDVHQNSTKSRFEP